ncbi:hypothetical protein [Sulfodiicoccus acidiphilus]|nr:hypothetical protein [Sulfodiicoccus acidiphilus]
MSSIVDVTRESTFTSTPYFSIALNLTSRSASWGDCLTRSDTRVKEPTK